MTNQPKDPNPSDSREEIMNMMRKEFKISEQQSKVLPYVTITLEQAAMFIQANYLSRAEVERAIGRNEDDPDHNPRWQAYRNELRAEIRQDLGLDTKKKETKND